MFSKTPKKGSISASDITSAGRRRAALASTEISVEAVTLLKCDKKHKLERYQTPYDNYTCSSCSKRFPWNTMMYGCRECDYDVCGRCINKLYPAPGTIVVQKNVEARKQALKSPGSELDGVGGGDISSRQRTTSMTREQYAQMVATPEERRVLKAKQRKREADDLQEREDAYSSRQGEISRTDAERKERLRAFKVSEQEYKRLQANLKPIVAAQKKADKEAAKRKAQKGKVEKQEAKRRADAEKAQKKVDKKGGKNLSTGLLALLTTKELTPLLASCGGADKKKVEEAHKAALHHEKCVAEELKDFQADEVAYAQETKERTEEMEEMKREYEEEKQERMADAEVEAKEAGDDAHEEATEAAREEMHVEDARIAGRRETHLHKNNANEAKLDVKYEVQKLAEDLVIANITADARKNEAKAKKDEQVRKDKEAYEAANAELAAGKGLKFSYLDAMGSGHIQKLISSKKLTTEEEEDATEELARAKEVELKEDARQKYLAKFDKEMRDKYKKLQTERRKRREREEKEQADIVKKREEDMKAAEKAEEALAKKLEGMEKKRSESFAKEASKLAKVVAKDEARRAKELKAVELEKIRREKMQDASFSQIEDDLDGDDGTERIKLTAGSLSILSQAQLQSLKKKSGKLKLSEEDLELVKEALVVAASVEEMEAAEQTRRLQRHERERNAEKEAENRCERRAEEAAKRAAEKIERDDKMRQFVLDQRTRRAAETKVEMDKREKRMAAQRALEAKQKENFDAAYAESVAKGKPVELNRVLGGEVSAEHLGKFYADLSQPKKVRDALREEIDLQVEVERARAEAASHREDDEKKRRKRVQAREKAEAMSRAAAAKREDMCEQRQAAAEKAEEALLVDAIKKKELFVKLDEEAEVKQGVCIAKRNECEEKKRPVILAQPAVVKEGKKKRKQEHADKVKAFKEKKEKGSQKALEEFDKIRVAGGNPKPALLKRLGGAALKKKIQKKAFQDDKALAHAELVLLGVEDDEKEQQEALEKEYDDLEASATAAESKAYGDKLAAIDAPYVKADKEKDEAAAKRDKAQAESNRAEKMHALAVKRVEFATKGKTRNVEQSEELREAQMRAMAEAKESEKAEQQETERQREKQAEEEKKIKQIRFEKAKEIKARKEKDAENMIQIDADLAGSKSLDLALLEPMGSGNLSELMQSGILDEREQEAVEGEYWRAVQQEADERAWEEKVEREENEMIARKIRDREKAIRQEEKRLLRNEALQAKLERQLADTQRRELNAEEDMVVKADLAADAHSRYEECDQAREQIEQESAEAKLAAKEEQRLWVVQMREEARLEHEKKVQEAKERSSKRSDLAKKHIDKLLEQQDKASDAKSKSKEPKKPVPLPEETLVMLGSDGLQELIESGKLKLEVDLVTAAKCRTTAEEVENEEAATMEKWRQNALMAAKMKSQAAEREIAVKANQACIEATKKASSAREKWRKADIAAQKAKEKYEGLCGKIEELTDSAEGRKNAETYKKELEDAAEKEEWIDPVKVETCAKYRVPLGPKAAAAVKKNKRMGVSQDKVMKEVSNKEKRQEQLERQAKKAEEALKKAKEAIEENERDLKRLKSNVEPGDNVNGESL